MNTILLAVILVAGIGLICGLGLAVASIVMAVPKDETAEKIRECLPGANCARAAFRAATVMPRHFRRARQKRLISALRAEPTLPKV